MPVKNIKKKTLWAALAVVLLVGGCTAVQTYQAPLAPTLPPAEPTQAAAVSAPAAVSAVPTVPVATCGQAGSMTILFVGSDSTNGVPPFGADSVRLVKVDFKTRRVAVVAFSRDLVVHPAALNDPAVVRLPVGLVFHKAYQAAAGSELEKNAAAAGVLARVLRTEYGVSIDHYATVEMSSMAEMIDTIGGVWLNVPEAVTTEKGYSYPAGSQTLDGDRSVEYVRFVFPGGDAGRTVRQNAFARALMAKVVSLEILPKVPTLLEQFKYAVATDLSPEQIVSMACLAGQLPEGGISFTAVDSAGQVSVNIPDTPSLKAYLSRTLGE